MKVAQKLWRGPPTDWVVKPNDAELHQPALQDATGETFELISMKEAKRRQDLSKTRPLRGEVAVSFKSVASISDKAMP